MLHVKDRRSIVRPVPRRTRLIALLTSTALVGANPAFAQSLPTGGSVAAGSATIGTPSNGTLTINQTSANAVVNWQTFNIGQGNGVTFVQPDASSAILNRVTGSTTTTIAGSLAANGQVYLVNPNGIAITPTGTINTGAFVASTLGISDDDFMAGKRTFSGNGASSSVTNAGAITINRGGYLALIGGSVENSGVITVPMGKAALGSGEQATLDLAGDGFLQVAIPTSAAGTKALVSNSGKISANGGTVQLSAAAAKDMARQAVNMSGTIEAKGVSGKSGDITLTGDDGEVAISGTLDAGNAAGTGGKVAVTGRAVKLASAKVDASGKTGGGTIDIGGERRGGGTLKHAKTLTVDAGTTINADAITSGNGGNVVLWSDDFTSFAGTITARGGSLSGNGGNAEVSGKVLLSYRGLTDLSAANGAFGDLLLDPYNVTISSGTDSNADGSFNATGNDSVINVNTLTNALATANVTVTTGSSSDVANPQAGTITVAAPINWSALTTLTLAAASDININSAITANGGLIVSSGGTISAPAAVDVGAFVLASGNWVQNSATLPAFSAQDFRITDGASFLRATGGDGSASSPYQVSDVYGLQGIGSSSANLRAKWKLVDDIDASGTADWNNGAGFVPIGTDSQGNGMNDRSGFTGNFDGQGHIISGLTINRPSVNRVGLFGLTTASVISNVGLVGGSISGNSDVGALAGDYFGQITNSYATSTVSGGTFTGGLVGFFESGTISDAYATGAVTSTGTYTGGLVGYSYGTISQAYATGRVSSAAYVGGLVGLSSGEINYSYATGAVSGTSGYVGGLVGYNYDAITNAYATGEVSANFGSYVGGLVGYNYATITNAYATGAVTGSASLGGLVGFNTSYGAITASYWDTETTGQSSACGGNAGTCTATGLTTAQARDSANSTTNYAGWDFDNIWFQSGDMRPILRSEAASADSSGVIAISNLHQLALMNANRGGKYKLAGDIDASETDGSDAAGIFSTGGWVPIGNDSATFTGSLDGAGHTINELTVNRSSETFVGLFGYIGSGGSVTNLGLVNTSVSGGDYVGGLAGRNDSVTINSYVTGAVSGSNGVGGLIGNSDGTISNSYATAAVSGNINVGGLVGYNLSATISNSYATGAVSGNNTVGGLVGINLSSTISNAYATGAVSGSVYAGGLVGFNYGTISASFWDSDTTGQANACGYNYSGCAGTGLATAQMADPFKFIDAGWDFSSIWAMSKTGGSPVLRSLTTDPVYDYYVRLSGNTSSTYGDAASIGGITVDGLGSTNVSLGWGSAITTSTGAGTHAYSDANVIALSYSTGAAGDYYVDYGSDGLTIAQRVLSLTGSRVYDGSSDVAAANVTLDNLANGETLTLTGAGSMTDKNVGIGKALSLGSLSLGDGTGLASNYTLVGGTGTVDIAKATISSITGIIADNKTYDGTTDVTWNTSGAGFTGMAAGDTLTVATSTGAFSNKNAGIGKTVDIAGLSLGGADAANYTLASDTATITADIARATLSSITGITADNKTYDGSTSATLNTSAAGFTGMVAGDALTVATATGTFSDKNAGSNKTVGITGLSLGGADAGNYTLASNIATTTADIAKATISSITGITAGNKTYDGGTSATLGTSGAGFTGMVAGDTLTVATATGAFSDKNAGSNKTVGITGLSLGGADEANYTLASTIATTTADIAKAYVFFNAISASSKVYDGTTTATVTISTVPVISTDDMHVGYTSANFSDKNAGSFKTVTIDGLYLTGADAGNYQLAITSHDTFASITRASITSIGGITAGNKTYDGTTDATLNTSGAVFNGMIAGDSLTVGSALGAFSDQNVGTGKTIGISGLTLGGADAQNYRLDTNTATTLADIDQRVVNLSGSRTYNGSTDLDASIFTLSNLVGGETLTLSGTGIMADKNAGSGKGWTLGSLALGDGTNGGLASNYTLAGGTDMVDIARATISSIGGITASGKTYDGTTDATLNTAGAVFNGMVSGDNLALGNGFSGTFSDKNAGTGKTVTISGLSLAGADAGNYMLASNTATDLADIAKRAITVTADGASRTYGDTNPALTYTVGGAGLVNNDTLTGSLLTSAGQYSNVGSYGIALGSLGNANYAITYTGANLMITPGALTVTADALSRAYGDANPTLTYMATGLVNGDTLSGSLSTSAGQYSNVGAYAVMQGSLANANYAITYSGADLTVNPRALTVTADALSKTYGDANPTLTYTLSGAGLVNGDTLSGSLSTAAGQYSNAGRYGITLGGLGNANYAIAYNGANLTVNQRTLMVTADALSKTYGDANPALTYTASGLVNGDTLSGSLSTAAGQYSNVGRYGITLGSLGNANYAITYTGANLTVNQRALTVTANALSKTYGDANPALTYTALGLVNSDALSGSLSTSAGQYSNIGAYAIAQGTLAASSNYALTYTGANLTVNPRAITVSADALNRRFGLTNPALTYTLGGEGLVNGDRLSGELATSATRFSEPGAYAITQGTLLASANYHMSFLPGVLTVELAADPKPGTQASSVAPTFDTGRFAPVQPVSDDTETADDSGDLITDPRFEGTFVCLDSGNGCVSLPAQATP